MLRDYRPTIALLRHGGHVEGITQNNVLLVPLLDLTGVCG